MKKVTTTDNTEKNNSEGKQNNNKKSNEGIITIIILIFLFIIGVFIALSFHYIPSRQMFFPKNNLTFSYTIITQEDITRLCERYNDASLFEKEAMNNEPIIRKLMEQGLIYEYEKVIDNNYSDESVENTVQTKEIETGTFKDSRDGKTYKTIIIGDLIWMAENLAYKLDSGCWAYNDNEENVLKYGYLYNWDAAKIACPNGWRIPSKNDWYDVHENDMGANDLKSKNEWNDYSKKIKDEATNISGFSALPGGARRVDGKYVNKGIRGYWWSQSEYNSTLAYFFELHSAEYCIYYDELADKLLGFSLRCVKDNDEISE